MKYPYILLNNQRPHESCQVFSSGIFHDEDIETTPIEYRMTVHLFVATSSPSCCNFALQHIAKENIDEFDTAVIDTVTRNIYVDDY
jgi:hypothetical protein